MSHAITVDGYDPLGAPNGLRWEKSSKSNVNNLDDSIGVAVDDAGQVRIGITTDPAQVPLTATRTKLAAFVAGAKAGEFDHLIA
ncbi:DUF397 domain-containing protein [Kitasatospora sp. NBC_01539]|uniref:DUF397 domain-containing protein n=1 Tax=Kitasatospora sp. NBC_01539 TaxID=2903577 RepID=UPI0038602806